MNTWARTNRLDRRSASIVIVGFAATTAIAADHGRDAKSLET